PTTGATLGADLFSSDNEPIACPRAAKASLRAKAPPKRSLARFGEQARRAQEGALVESPPAG
ncbi:MAG TPA: hypothetical protein VN878_08790, partial [Usitatibacter sp.]|nr:hypothetical protein [Usitatibacter sp.]